MTLRKSILNERGYGHFSREAPRARLERAAARPVVDNKLLAKPFRQPLPHQACSYVGAAARSKADDHAHRPRRIGLRPRDARHGWQRGSARGQMQKISAGKFHSTPL